jgi:hypothetical protein
MTRQTRHETRRYETRKRNKKVKAAPSENITRLEHDHHFKTTSGTRFHTDHAHLCIGVVQITTGESSEIFCSCWIGGGDPVMNKRMRKGRLNKVRCIILRSVAEAEGVAFWIYLRRNILETYLGNMNRYPPERWVVLAPGYLGRVLRWGIHTQGPIARVTTSIKRRLVRWTGATDTY